MSWNRSVRKSFQIGNIRGWTIYIDSLLSYIPSWSIARYQESHGLHTRIRYAFASLTSVLIRNFVSDHDESITRSRSCFPNTYRIRRFSHEMKTKNSRYLHFFEDQFRSLLN